MTILKVTSALFTLLVFGAMDVYACSCDTYGVPRTDAKEYYTKKFKGAIFTGTVQSIEHDPAYEGGGITFSKLKVAVDQYWLGVRTPAMIVEVGGPNTSCWFDWKVGEEVFFIARDWKGTLRYSHCDLANWKPNDSTASVTEYATALLGKSRSFRKSK